MKKMYHLVSLHQMIAMKEFNLKVKMNLSSKKLTIHIDTIINPIIAEKTTIIYKILKNYSQHLNQLDKNFLLEI